MITTIREYAARRLADSGESETARRAHLAHFTNLAETAEPHLRRADQLEWLAVLGVEHDNIGSAMRGALAAGDAHAAMRLAASMGWYWWLSGHRAEGIELIFAATRAPGQVPDEIRAMVYGLVVLFVSSGRGDAHQAEEWIHKAYRFGRQCRSRHPLTVLVAPLERMVEEPGAFLPAWEPLLDDEDPWIRALARLHLGRMRIMLGQGGRDADRYLETALAEFRAIGERFGMSFALTELADRIATRGEFARACEYYEQAIAVVSEVGAIEDVLRMRSRQAQLYWLMGDTESSAAAMAEAQCRAERVTWPDALAELALARAELARWSGDAEQAHRHIGVVTALLGDRAELVNIRMLTHEMLGYLTDDLRESRRHRVAACDAAAETGHPSLVAQTIVGVADLALRGAHYEQAARLLAASSAVGGLPDRSNPEVARIERIVRGRLGEDRFAEATREGTYADWSDLTAVTLTA